MHHYLLQNEQEESQELQLSVKCFDLINFQTRAPIDSFIVVKLLERNKPIRQLVKSRIYWGCLNPEYEEKIKLKFCFKNQMNLLIEIFSHETSPRLFGWVQTTVSKIFGSRDKIFQENLKMHTKQKNSSTIKIECKKIEKSPDQTSCWKLNVESFQIQPLRKLYFFAEKSPFYFTLSKILKNSSTLLYKSEKSASFEHCQFQQFCLSKSTFKEGNSKFILQINQQKGQSCALVGQIIFCPHELQLTKSLEFNLTNHAQKNVGSIKLSLVEQFSRHTFTDYLDAGLQFKVICNIDFTASNKKVCDPESLHRIIGGLSPYEEAMSQSLKILLDYDTDKLIPTYGFGAKVFLPNYNSQGKVSHCFPLNGDITNPNLKQLSGVLRAYRKALSYLEFAGPTNFTQIIKNAIFQCETSCSDLSQYTIAFILTDGKLHDICSVIDLIDKNSHLPLSIIIVGLGQSDFTQMKTLDGDQNPLLNSRGKKVRDIVQFVNFEQCKSSNSTLAVNILEQLPVQVLSFYSVNQITPQKIRKAKLEKQMPLQLKASKSWTEARSTEQK